MKISASWAIAALLTAVLGMPGSSLAGENGASAKPADLLKGLAGSAVPAAELQRQQARGIESINFNNIKNVNVDTRFNFDGALSNGSLRGNSVIGDSTTGTITTTGSINNNTGITTVFQNSGNNSLFQQTTSIVITLH
jgi:hypothetical protein